MHRENSRCHWCKRVTILYVRKGDEGLPKNAATRDHLVMKKDRVKGEKGEVVLACYECNHRRSVVQCASTKPERERKRRVEQLKKDWKGGFYW